MLFVSIPIRVQPLKLLKRFIFGRRVKLERAEKKLRHLVKDILHVTMSAKVAVNLLMTVVNKKSVRSG